MNLDSDQKIIWVNFGGLNYPHFELPERKGYHWSLPQYWPIKRTDQHYVQ